MSSIKTSTGDIGKGVRLGVWTNGTRPRPPGTIGTMRWDALFDDLEAQLAALQEQERRGEVAEHTRAERGRVDLGERLLAHRGRSVTLHVRGVGRVSGTLEDLAPTWLLLGREGVAAAGTRVLIHRPALLSVSGLGRHSAPYPGEVARRLGLGPVLRALSRDRAFVRLVDVEGTRLAGRIDRVGRDHLDLTPLPDEGTARAGGAVTETVPYEALAALIHGS